MQLPYANVEPIERKTPDDFGLTVNGGRLFHVKCLENLLAYENGPGISAFAHIIFPEPRPARNPNAAELWKPSKAYSYIIEVWKAISEYDHRLKANLSIPFPDFPVITARQGQYCLARRGPHDTVFTSQEVLDVCVRIDTSILGRFQTENMRGYLLRELFSDKSKCVSALQNRIEEDEARQAALAQQPNNSLPPGNDQHLASEGTLAQEEESQEEEAQEEKAQEEAAREEEARKEEAREEAAQARYNAWIESQGLELQPPHSYHRKPKVEQDALKDAVFAWASVGADHLAQDLGEEELGETLGEVIEQARQRVDDGLLMQEEAFQSYWASCLYSRKYW